MKKMLVLAFVITSAFGLVSCAGGYVAQRPAEVVLTRPPMPGPGYVWVDGGYAYQHGKYVQRPGRWVAPKPGKTYQSGQWKQTSKGYKWQKGRWHK